MKPSAVRVIFDDQQVNTLKRSESYTIANFLSNCGGLLGLFLGVSVLSIVELIYYATLRLFWSFRKQQSTNITLVHPIRKMNANSIFIDMSND